jgi:hypothetical protein
VIKQKVLSTSAGVRYWVMPRQKKLVSRVRAQSYSSEIIKSLHCWADLRLVNGIGCALSSRDILPVPFILPFFVFCHTLVVFRKRDAKMFCESEIVVKIHGGFSCAA